MSPYDAYTKVSSCAAYHCVHWEEDEESCCDLTRIRHGKIGQCLDYRLKEAGEE